MALRGLYMTMKTVWHVEGLAYMYTARQWKKGGVTL